MNARKSQTEGEHTKAKAQAKQKNERIKDAVVRLGDVPPQGRKFVIETSADERAAIAARLGILAVDRLSARVTVRPLRGGLEVKGELEADVSQACVISFEPVPQHIAEPFERVFLPGKEPRYEGPAEAEIFVDLENEALPDHFEGGELDLSELLIETVSLALDAYPRHPDAQVPKALASDPETDRPSAFAILKSLKSSRD